LRLGMFVQMTFQMGPGERRTLVLQASVQSVGGRTVVYVATEDEGRFVERAVKVGALVGDAVQVLEGLKMGETVVTEGSFFLRAEAGRARTGG
jgi:multidrug efflux pump subunit AcrA (membrane-fusion protein)